MQHGQITLMCNLRLICCYHIKFQHFILNWLRKSHFCVGQYRLSVTLILNWISSKRLISCRCTSCHYLRKVSLKPVEWFMRSFVKHMNTSRCGKNFIVCLLFLKNWAFFFTYSKTEGNKIIMYLLCYPQHLMINKEMNQMRYPMHQNMKISSTFSWSVTLYHEIQ